MLMTLKESLTSWLWRKPLLLLELLLLSGLLTACATPSPVLTPAPCPMPPAAPRLPATLAKPVSPESYSESAQRRIQAWQQTLTGSETK